MGRTDFLHRSKLPPAGLSGKAPAQTMDMMNRPGKGPRSVPPAARPLQRDTILVVDDDVTFRSEFRECFQEYAIVEASNAEEALQLLKKPNEIDLVVLDVRMAGMSGLDALERIKDASPGLGVVIVTGHGSKEIVIRALRGMADDYIEKPFDIDAARESIEKILEKRRGAETGDAADLPAKIERVKRFVRRNYLKKVGLRDASRVVCLSPKYLSRVFKEHTGVGFGRYRLSLRIERAKELLAESGRTIDQISYALGYENAESFTRQFKKLTGRTPSQFRRTRRKRRTQVR